MEFRLISIAILMLVFASVVGQSKYDDYFYTQDGLLLYEDFNENINGWPTENSNKAIIQLVDGVYQVQSVADNYYPNPIINLTPVFTIDTERDFQIEMDLKFLRGTENQSNVLMWGKNKAGHNFRHGFSGNGQFIISKHQGSFTNFKNWTPSDVIKKQEFNRLTVRKVKSKYYFFINEVLVHEEPFQPLFGQGIGLTLARLTTVQADNLKVGYISKKPTEWMSEDQLATSNSAYEAAQYDAFKSTETLFSEDFTDNSYDWFTGYSENKLRKYTIEDGHYTLQSLATGQFSKINFNTKGGFSIDENRSYQVEVSMKYVTGEDNNSNSLIWGQADNLQDRYVMGFSGNGKWILSRFQNDSWTTLKSWANSSSINKYDYNKLTVRKVKGNNYYYINEELVWVGAALPFMGSSFAVMCNQNTTLFVDDIHISYLEPNEGYEGKVVAQNVSQKEESHAKTVAVEKTTATSKSAITKSEPSISTASSPVKYIQFIADHPDYKTAMKAYDEENYDRANQLFESLIKRYPDQSEGYLRAALTSVQAENYGKAIAYFDVAHLINPTDISVLVNKSIFYAVLGKTSEANEFASTVARMMASNQYEYYNRYITSWKGYFDYYNPQGAQNIAGMQSVLRTQYQNSSHDYAEEVGGKIFIDLKRGGTLKYAGELSKRLQNALKVMYDSKLPYDQMHYMMHFTNKLLDEQYRRPDLSADWKDWIAGYQSKMIYPSMFADEANGYVTNPFLYCRYTDKKYAIMISTGDYDNALALNTVRIEKAGESPYLKFELINLYAERLILLSRLGQLGSAKEIAGLLTQALNQYTAPELLIKGHLALNNYYLKVNTEQAIVHGHKAEEISQESGFTEVLMFIYNNLSLAYLANDKKEEGVKYARLSAELAPTAMLKAQNYTTAGVQFTNTDHELAIELLEKAEGLYNEHIASVNDYHANQAYTSLYNSNVNLALAHKWLEDDESAFNAIERAQSKRLASEINNETLKATTAREVQAMLKPDQVLLYYAEKLFDFGDLGFCMVAITKEKVTFKYIQNVTGWVNVRNKYSTDLALIEREIAQKELRSFNFNMKQQTARQPGDFNLMTEMLRRAFKENDRPKIAEVGGSYYDAFIGLFQDEIAGKKELIVVPTGPLTFIPFEGLLSREGRLLIEDYDLSYIHSPTVLRELSNRNYEASKSILAMGGANYGKVNTSIDPVKSATDIEKLRYEVFNKIKGDEGSLRSEFYGLGYGQMTALPGTTAEVEKIKEIVPSTDTYFGDQMSESKLKELSRGGMLDDYKVLHLATHGWVENFIPALTGFAMTVFPDEQNGEDGHVYLHEVNDLDIEAELVMLSACQTGLGKLQTGKGVAGLNQAFIGAGANSTITSLWTVSDYATSVLVSELYRMVFKDGKTFRKALCEVKRGFITGKYDKGTGQLNNTSFWAPFIYYGKL